MHLTFAYSVVYAVADTFNFTAVTLASSDYLPRRSYLPRSQFDRSSAKALLAPSFISPRDCNTNPTETRYNNACFVISVVWRFWLVHARRYFVRKLSFPEAGSYLLMNFCFKVPCLAHLWEPSIYRRIHPTTRRWGCNTPLPRYIQWFPTLSSTVVKFLTIMPLVNLYTYVCVRRRIA